MLKNNYEELSNKLNTLITARKTIELDIDNAILNIVNNQNLLTFNLTDLDSKINQRNSLILEHFQYIKSLRDKISLETSNFEEKLPFFDKYFWGILGNKENNKTLSLFEELSTKSSIEVAAVSLLVSKDLREELSKIERSLIHNKLMSEDESYFDNQALFENLSNSQRDLKTLIEEADKVISSISSSEGMETLDMFTSNKGIALMSTISTSSTSDDIKNFQESLNRFYDNNRETLETLNIIDFVGDMLDVGFGFDIVLGFMQLSSLGEAKSQIKEVKEELSRELSELISQSNKVKSKLQHSISQKVRL